MGTLEKFSAVLGSTQAHMDTPGEATREGQPNSNSSIRINTSPLRFQCWKIRLVHTGVIGFGRHHEPGGGG